jgi:hypothetical protein
VAVVRGGRSPAQDLIDLIDARHATLPVRAGRIVVKQIPLSLAAHHRGHKDRR